MPYICIFIFISKDRQKELKTSTCSQQTKEGFIIMEKAQNDNNCDKASESWLSSAQQKFRLINLRTKESLKFPVKKVFYQWKQVTNHMDDKAGLKDNPCSSKQELTTFTLRNDRVSSDQSGIYQDKSPKPPIGKHPQSQQQKKITSALQQNNQNRETKNFAQLSTKNKALTFDISYPNQTFKQTLQVLYLLEINQLIIDTVDRNRTYSCYYVHFLIPYLLVVLEIKTIHKDRDHKYHDKIYAFVLRKLNLPALQSQLKSVDIHIYLSFFRRGNVERLQVLTMLRIFMTEQKESIMKVCPYYYNFFVMVCNKETIFGNSIQPLLPYTVKQHQLKRYPSNTKNDIRKELSLLQKALVKEYHSPDIC